MSFLIGDIETNGLIPSKIHVVGVLDYITDEYTSYTGDRVVEGLCRLATADAFIGHYIKGYDVPQIERLTAGLITFDQKKLIDTVELSRRYCKELPNHKLETWGSLLGFPKLPKPDSWDNYEPYMEVYCERDCRVNKMIFDILLEYENPFAAAK